jgi:hypothetical protein
MQQMHVTAGETTGHASTGKDRLLVAANMDASNERADGMVQFASALPNSLSADDTNLIAQLRLISLYIHRALNVTSLAFFYS